MKRTELIVASATLVLIAYTLTISIVGVALSSLKTSRTIPNTGTVKAIGVGVYLDSGFTNPVSSINWGMLEPGSSKNVTYYIRNEGNSPSTLSMNVTNWNPLSASSYITLRWNYGGQSINPGNATRVTFTLSVSATIQGITTFSFDIIIIGSG